MAFAEYVLEHPEMVLKMAEENRKQGKVIKTLYAEWEKEHSQHPMMNFY